MARTITKVWEYAGTDPGQHITLTLTFKERRCRKVIVEYDFEVKSLGRERFSPTQRWNKTTIWIYGVPFTWTYNLYGERVVWRKTGTFEIDDVGDVVTLMEIEFLNERLGNFGSDPYTTGVITRQILGKLDILENEQFHLQFYHGFEDDSITKLPPMIYGYWGRDIYFPDFVPIDPSGRYICTGWTTVVPGVGIVNLAKPMYKLGDIHRLERNLMLYACWEPCPHRWEFYVDELCLEMFIAAEFMNPIIYYTGGFIDLPDLRVLYAKYGRAMYYRPGYEFGGWYWYDRYGIRHYGFRCDLPYPVRFWPYWIPRRFEIVFDFGWGVHQIIRTYNPGAVFNFLDIMYDPVGHLLPGPTMIRPGFQLIGWALEPPPPRFLWYRPGMPIPPPPFWFDHHGPIPYTTRIVLHAVWIKLSDAYVFTEGRWHLTAPFVYTEDRWELTHADIYTRNDWRM